MKTIDFSYFIERYLAGEMNEAEKLWFQKELEGNDSLQKEVELRKKTDLVLKNKDVINLRNKLSRIEKERKSDVTAANSGNRIRMNYTAGISILIIAGALALFTGKKLSDDEIFSRHYKLYEAATASRAGHDALNSDYDLAMGYYKVHDFRNAAIFFKRVLENEPGNMQSALLNGVSNFEIRNYPEANRSFFRVIEDNNNLYIDHAQWYLALCYVKTGEREKAIQSLSVIKEANSVYSRDARKVLRELGKGI